MRTCPKCQGKMEPGFAADSTYGGFVTPQWIAGRVERNFLGGLKLRGRVRRWIETYRCEHCGYLEAYAR